MYHMKTLACFQMWTALGAKYGRLDEEWYASQVPQIQQDGPAISEEVIYHRYRSRHQLEVTSVWKSKCMVSAFWGPERGRLFWRIRALCLSLVNHGLPGEFAAYFAHHLFLAWMSTIGGAQMSLWFTKWSMGEKRLKKTVLQSRPAY